MLCFEKLSYTFVCLPSVKNPINRALPGSSPEADFSHVTSGPILDDFIDVKYTFSGSLTHRGDALEYFLVTYFVNESILSPCNSVEFLEAAEILEKSAGCCESNARAR